MSSACLTRRVAILLRGFSDRRHQRDDFQTQLTLKLKDTLLRYQTANEPAGQPARRSEGALPGCLPTSQPGN